MTGFLRTMDSLRVGEALRPFNPQYHIVRRDSTTQSLNLIPYSAHYFGHKIHIDQKEKLVMYAVTHVPAIYGYSSKVVAFITTPICIEIYSHLYKYV